MVKLEDERIMFLPYESKKIRSADLKANDFWLSYARAKQIDSPLAMQQTKKVVDSFSTMYKPSFERQMSMYDDKLHVGIQTFDPLSSTTARSTRKAYPVRTNTVVKIGDEGASFIELYTWIHFPQYRNNLVPILSWGMSIQHIHQILYIWRKNE